MRTGSILRPEYARELTHPWGGELDLGVLRADWPHIGFLHLPDGRWIAAWGAAGYREADRAAELRALLEAS